MKSLVLSLAVLALTTIPMRADSLDAGLLYTYTGNPFTTFTNGASCPPDCQITGWFSVLTSLANLGDNYNGAFVPLDFSFTDGNVTFTKSEFPDTWMSAQTDASGNIIAWSITLGADQVTGDQDLYTLSGPGLTSHDGYDEVINDMPVYLPPTLAQAYNYADAGVWTMQAFTTTPEPATGWLMLAALPMLLLAKRKAARSR